MCLHKNIFWKEVLNFNKDKDFNNEVHCVDCGETKGKGFFIATTRWYKKKIDDWLKDNNLAEKYVYNDQEAYTFIDWTKFIQKNNYEEVWNDFCRGKLDPDYFEGLLKQGLFFEFAQSIEQLLQEFKKEKQKDNPNEREQKIKSLKKRISKLENKSNRTPEEEQELKDKKQELAQLERKQNDQSPNNWIKPVLIGGGVLLGVALIVYLVISSQKRKHTNY